MRIWSIPAAVLLVFAVTACGTASTDPENEASPSGAITSPTLILDSSSSLTEEKARGLRLESLQQRAIAYGISDYQPPNLVRWINIVDFPQVSAECLTSAGFPSRADDGVVRTPGIGPSQAKALQSARLDCDSRYSVHPYYSLPASPKRAGKLYDWLVDSAVPCLESHGRSPPLHRPRPTSPPRPRHSGFHGARGCRTKLARNSTGLLKRRWRCDVPKALPSTPSPSTTPCREAADEWRMGCPLRQGDPLPRWLVRPISSDCRPHSCRKSQSLPYSTSDEVSAISWRPTDRLAATLAEAH